LTIFHGQEVAAQLAVGGGAVAIENLLRGIQLYGSESKYVEWDIAKAQT
jgi:hypothetical protein